MCFTADKQVVGIGSLDDTLCSQNTGEGELFQVLNEFTLLMCIICPVALEHIKMFHLLDPANDSSTFEGVKVANHNMESTTTKRTDDTKPVEQVCL